MELKSKITEMKSTLDKLTNRFQWAEERTRELGEKSIDIHPEESKVKEENELSLRDLWDNIK